MENRGLTMALGLTLILWLDRECSQHSAATIVVGWKYHYHHQPPPQDQRDTISHSLGPLCDST